MSVSHHGSNEDMSRRQDELMKRFIEQAEGKAKRAFSKGRLNADDDGDLAIAVSADQEHGRVIINFGKHVDWIGLDANDCVNLAKMLIEKARLVSREPLVITL